MSKSLKSSITDNIYHNVEYLGDSVYLGVDEPFGRVWLFLYNGDEIKNEICLEDDAMGNLIIACRKFGYKDLIND
jgi:hypothetical protein